MMCLINQWLKIAVLAIVCCFPMSTFAGIESDFLKQIRRNSGMMIGGFDFNAEELDTNYIQGEIFDTCRIEYFNKEQFALIDNRALQSLMNNQDSHLVLNFPNHHLVILDPISARMLTLQGKSVTFLASVTIDEDLTINVPKKAGNIIVYGASILVGNKSNITGDENKRLMGGSRVINLTYFENDEAKSATIDMHDIILRLFRKGIRDRSGKTIAFALMQVGEEVLKRYQREISNDDILALWNLSWGS